MDGAKVIVIEDSELERGSARINLEAAGHSVVAEAATLEDGLNLVDTVAEGGIEADVILLDGNLTPDTDKGDDARAIAERIKERGIASKVIGFSLLPFKHYKIDVDADSMKDMNTVIEAISSF